MIRLPVMSPADKDGNQKKGQLLINPNHIISVEPCRHQATHCQLFMLDQSNFEVAINFDLLEVELQKHDMMRRTTLNVEPS